MDNSKKLHNKAHEAFEATRNLLRLGDFVDNSSIHWDMEFLEKMYLIAFNETENLEDFLGWLNFTAEKTGNEELFIEVFRKEFPKLTAKYSINEIFNTFIGCYEWCYVLQDREWCMSILNKNENNFRHTNEYITAGTFVLRCCNNEEKACGFYSAAEKHCKTFDEFYKLVRNLIYELHDKAWAFDVLLQSLSLIKNTEEAGDALSIADTIKEYNNNLRYSSTVCSNYENLFCIIQSRILNWKSL